MTIIDNDLLSIQEARILAENAFDAQKSLATFPQEKLDTIVACVADAVEKHLQTLAVSSCEETDYGKWQDKYVKNRFVCEYARNHLSHIRCVGVIGEDKEKRMMDIGVPVGVIIAMCPATSPVSTSIYKTLIAIKSGNAIIFSPHPRARKTIGNVLDIMIEAASSQGLPEGCLSYLHTVTKAGTIELMAHTATSLVLNTSVPGMLRAAYEGGKPVIYGGTGNGPAFIERTADIRQAVSDIIASKTFDHGIVASAEQSIVVDSCIANEVRLELQKSGAYFMSEEESHTFASLFFCPNGKLNNKMVGISAKTLAQRAGFSVPDNVSVLIAERKYVSDTDPYSREMLCPVLTYFVEDDWMHACEKCIELLISERNGHTLVIHSNDEDVIRQFALKKPVGRLLVNTPGTFGGIGATTNLFPSMTLGSGSAGDGITSDNVSPLNLIYIRKVGYGVRPLSAVIDTAGNEKTTATFSHMENGFHKNSNTIKNLDTLQRILKEAIDVMDGSSDR